MRIVCYFINYNDSFYIPFLAKHYSKFCEKIVMYDQYSTDNSVDLAKHYGMEVRYFGNRTELNDQWYLDVKNNCWKECRDKGIDYVIVCDADEFLNWLPDFKMTDPIPTIKGFNMICETLPTESIFEINTGEYSEGYSKQIIFNPDIVEEINYVHGCHKNWLTHKPYDKENEITYMSMFHYRMIGGVQRLIDRHMIYRQRLSLFNKKHGMAFHYNHSDNAKIEEWNYLKSKSVALW